MIQFGNSITTAGDNLQKISIEQLFDKITKPNSELCSKINQLQIIRSIDENQYRKLKTSLPYIVCGIFNPPIRKRENFASVIYFIIDIDHLSQKAISAQDLKSKLSADKRIYMMFSSPSNDGLKIIFKLKEKIYDYAKYSMFYKLFAHSFSIQYNLEQVVDLKTSDVTRACFLSYDKEAFCNKNAEEVIPDAYINFENDSDIFDKEIRINEIGSLIKSETPKPEPQINLTDDLLNEIKKKLNPKLKTKAEKHIYIPPELDKAIIMFTNKLNEYSLTVKNIENIHYGKKVRVEVGLKWAEINIFYGKKGFSVVKTPKGGSNADLAEIAVSIINEMIN